MGLKQIIRAVGPLAQRYGVSSTGFSGRGVGWRAAELRVCKLTSSRLKPVPLWKCMSTVGLALAGIYNDFWEYSFISYFYGINPAQAENPVFLF